MADPRFFENAGPFSVAELAAKIGASLPAGADGDRQVGDIAPLDDAGVGDVTFLDNPKYLDAFRRTNAGACIAGPKFADEAPEGLVLLLSDEPYRAYARAAASFYPKSVEAAETFDAPGVVHDDATVHPSARLAEGVTVEPGARVGAGVEIGRGSVIGANATIGKNCTLGTGCFIGPNVSISHAHLGDRVILHPGVRVGQDGFGFAMGLPEHLKVAQTGRVIVQDDVEIGANSTIDRGAGPDTVIGAGTKIDNLVQIGHNVTTGRGCIIVAQTGVSGSAKLEDFVVLAAQTGVTGHLTIGAGAQLAARGAIVKDVPPGAQMGGAPARPLQQWKRELAAVALLARRKKGGK